METSARNQLDGPTVRSPYLAEGLSLEWDVGPIRIVHFELDVCPFRLELGVGPSRIVASSGRRPAPMGESQRP